MPRKSRQHPPHDQDLRARLREVTRGLLAEEGPAALSLRRIAKQAGTSTTAIYSLFGNKEELLRDLCREGSRELGAAMAAVPRTRDPVADVESLGQAYRRWALSAPLTYRVLFGGLLNELELEERDLDEMRDGLTQLVATVARCVAEARYRPGDPALIAFELWGLVHGLVSLELNGQIESGDAERVFGAALQTASRGLAAS